MKYGAPAFPPRRQKLFFLSLRISYVEDGVSMPWRTWTTGSSVAAALKDWLTQNPGRHIEHYQILSGNLPTVRTIIAYGRAKGRGTPRGTAVAHRETAA